ncbi:MAG: HD domain-containing phosphohydrolase [Calditrichia bacterium]
MKNDISINIFEFFLSVSGAVELINPMVSAHHRHVAYIALSLGDYLTLSEQEKQELFVAAALHDVGALSIAEWKNNLLFETSVPHLHAEIGYLFLNDFPQFKNVAEIIRYHHTPWGNGSSGVSIPPASQIIQLADRIDILIRSGQFILQQVDEISHKIQANSGSRFNPELISVYSKLARRESFWLDLSSSSLNAILAEKVDFPAWNFSLQDFEDLVRMFSRLIDFKSYFTSTHSAGVSATAEALAGLIGFTESEQQLIRVAGYLHDIGKLVVPSEILDKPERLTPDEFAIMRSHTYYTHQIIQSLREVEGMNVINKWAALHHERMDGSGYPFHYADGDIPQGSKIVAVADVFTALAENRPYRAGLPKNQVMPILRTMGENEELDNEIVAILDNHYQEVNQSRETAQKKALAEYRRFKEQIRRIA